jgi:hypothetical protein
MRLFLMRFKLRLARIASRALPGWLQGTGLDKSRSKATAKPAEAVSTLASVGALGIKKGAFPQQQQLLLKNAVVDHAQTDKWDICLTFKILEYLHFPPQQAPKDLPEPAAQLLTWHTCMQPPPQTSLPLAPAFFDFSKVVMDSRNVFDFVRHLRNNTIFI